MDLKTGSHYLLFHTLYKLCHCILSLTGRGEEKTIEDEAVDGKVLARHSGRNGSVCHRHKESRRNFGFLWFHWKGSTAFCRILITFRKGSCRGEACKRDVKKIWVTVLWISWLFFCLMQIRSRGEQPTNNEIIKFSKLFEDEITLGNMTHEQLKAINRMLNLPTIGSKAYLRFQLYMKLRQLRADDVVSTDSKVSTAYWILYVQ